MVEFCNPGSGVPGLNRGEGIFARVGFLVLSGGRRAGRIAGDCLGAGRGWKMRHGGF
jgi:hypothetical protein